MSITVEQYGKVGGTNPSVRRDEEGFRKVRVWDCVQKRWVTGDRVSDAALAAMPVGEREWVIARIAEVDAWNSRLAEQD